MSESLNCPRCTEPMKARKDRRGLVAVCAGCGGVWAETKSAKAAGQRPDAAAFDAEHPAQRAPSLEPLVDCPRCAETMDRVEVGPVTIDHCEAHGRWFDDGELLLIRKHFNPELANDLGGEGQNYEVTSGNVLSVQREHEYEIAQARGWVDNHGPSLADTLASFVSWVNRK